MHSTIHQKEKISEVYCMIIWKTKEKLIFSGNFTSTIVQVTVMEKNYPMRKKDPMQTCK